MKKFPTTERSVLIVGASARAAAESAANAGYQPTTIDLFGDLQTRRVAQWFQADHFDDFTNLVANVRSEQWMYTGGVECRPHLIRQFDRRMKTLGFDAQTVKRVTSPLLLQTLLSGGPVSFAKTTPNNPETCPPGQWLEKPRRSCGGQGIRRLGGGPRRETAHSPPSRTRDSVLQSFVEGESYSAVFAGSARSVRLLGVTQQHVGIPFLGAAEFSYCASVAGVPVSPRVRSQLTALGDWLGKRLPLRGIFGVDFIVSANQVFVIEINPRWPASTETLEMHRGFNAFEIHRRACLNRLDWTDDHQSASGICLKAYLFSKFTRTIEITAAMIDALNRMSAEEKTVRLTDTGVERTKVPPGHPVLTILVSESMVPNAWRQLRETVEQIDAILAETQ